MSLRWQQDEPVQHLAGSVVWQSGPQLLAMTTTWVRFTAIPHLKFPCSNFRRTQAFLTDAAVALLMCLLPGQIFRAYSNRVLNKSPNGAFVLEKSARLQKRRQRVLAVTSIVSEVDCCDSSCWQRGSEAARRRWPLVRWAAGCCFERCSKFHRAGTCLLGRDGFPHAAAVLECGWDLIAQGFRAVKTEQICHCPTFCFCAKQKRTRCVTNQSGQLGLGE